MKKQRSILVVTLIALMFVVQLVLPAFVPFARATNVGINLLEVPDLVVVSPNPKTISVGEIAQMTATARFTVSGNPDIDVTNSPYVQWSIDNGAIATVSGVGAVSGVSGGTTIVHATYGGVVGSATVNVYSEGPDAGGGFVNPAPVEPPVQPVIEPPVVEPPTPGEPPVQPVIPPPVLPGPPPPGGEQFAPSPEGELPPTPSELPSGGSISSETTTSSGVEVGTSSQTETMFPMTTQLSPIFLPPELSVSRGEILYNINKVFDIEGNKKELLGACLNDLNGCLSIFLSVTNFKGVVVDSSPVVFNGFPFSIFQVAKAASIFDLGKLQLFPDVPPDIPYAHDINVAALFGVIQGYYEEPNSPFKPYQIITRVEALKVLLNTGDLMKWLYYDELEATLGGLDGIKNQMTPFADITSVGGYMWWYPRYINKACEVEMITCAPGTKFRPDEYVTDAEMNSMITRLKASLDYGGFAVIRNGDPDDDTLKTYLEDMVYFTNPNNKDTDSDQLQDNEEVKDYGTSPFLSDTDQDSLSDYQETKVYYTDPLNVDTDADGYSDSDEIRSNSDPLDQKSVPVDANNNGVADTWEQTYSISIVDGTSDIDKDGVSDKIEYQLGTNPLEVDTDHDGYTDSQEILELHTDPLNPADPGTLDNIGVRITNFQEGQLVGDNTPLVKGVAPAGVQVRLILRNHYGHEKVLGDTKVDDNSMFLFQVSDPIRDGKYQLVAKALRPEKKSIIVSVPVSIVIDSTLNVVAPVPKKIADKDLNPDVILKNLRVEIRDKRPVLVGEAGFGDKVTATWRSLVATSALIADASGGEFAIASPAELEIGQHEVYVMATRKNDSAQSDTVKVLFSVGIGFGSDVMLKGAAEAGKYGIFSFGGVVDFATKQGPLFVILVITGIVFVVGGAYYVSLNRKKHKR